MAKNGSKTIDFAATLNFDTKIQIFGILYLLFECDVLLDKVKEIVDVFV